MICQLSCCLSSNLALAHHLALDLAHQLRLDLPYNLPLTLAPPFCPKLARHLHLDLSRHLAKQLARESLHHYIVENGAGQSHLAQQNMCSHAELK
uniref:Uncharacterized protein n=1 Tax=Romanomermis culicivorax TaxID=13658 RepID=A0A915JIH0_ROMCU